MKAWEAVVGEEKAGAGAGAEAEEEIQVRGERENERERDPVGSRSFDARELSLCIDISKSF